MKLTLGLMLLLSMGCVLHYDHANVKSPPPKIGRDSCIVTNECPKRCFFVDNGPYLHGRYECK